MYMEIDCFAEPIIPPGSRNILLVFGVLVIIVFSIVFSRTLAKKAQKSLLLSSWFINYQPPQTC